MQPQDKVLDFACRGISVSLLEQTRRNITVKFNIAWAEALTVCHATIIAQKDAQPTAKRGIMRSTVAPESGAGDSVSLPDAMWLKSRYEEDTG
jgi:hypothetical protein